MGTEELTYIFSSDRLNLSGELRQGQNLVSTGGVKNVLFIKNRFVQFIDDPEWITYL